MLTRMQSNWNSPTFLVRMQNGPVTSQNSLEVSHKVKHTRASLVAQWLRICLPMQGTWVQALVWKDPTCRGATRPVSHNY